MPTNFSVNSKKDLFDVYDVTGTTSPASELRAIWNAQNIGNGVGIYSGRTNQTILFKTLNAGSNITLTPTASGITISSSGGGGGSVTASNGLTKVDDDIQLGGTLGAYTELALGEDGILGIYNTNPVDGGAAIQIVPYGLLLNGGTAGAGTLNLTNNGFQASSGFGEVSIVAADANVPLKLVGQVGGNVTSIILTPHATTPTLVVDTTSSNFAGIRYAGNYSANFTNGSLVDKRYVTGITTTLQPTMTGNNGLTKVGNNVRLGGSLTGATTIFTSTSNRLNIDGWPLNYTSDLSANFSAGSLIDKRYVTGITTTKTDKLASIINVGASYSITNADSLRIIQVTGSSNSTITIPSGLTSGLQFTLNNLMSSNTVTVSLGGGTTNKLKGTVLGSQYAGASIYIYNNAVSGFGNFN